MTLVTRTSMKITTFLVATAMVWRETFMRFERTIAQLTEIVMRPGSANREFIVTFQDFDRLKQEVRRNRRGEAAKRSHA
jgi:hypothetical protein